MNGGPQQPSFEETIHRVSFSYSAWLRNISLINSDSLSLALLFSLQLKVQEALRKKEKFQREHEEVR